MKVYGASRNRETATCRYKCCGGKLAKTLRRTKIGRAATKARRKTARAWAKREIADQG